LKSVRTYWWTGKANFGDALTPLLLKHFCGIETELAHPSVADLVVAGSVLDVLPQKGWTGIVAGAGKLKASTKTDLTQAHVLGVRGKLTLADIKLSSFTTPSTPTLGDPALLISEMTRRQKPTWPLGVVPHWSDTRLFDQEMATAEKWNYAKPVYINVADDPLSVVRDISACEKIVTSSLHGAIIADSYGIPRRIERFPMIDSPHEGGDFKWRDHNGVVGLEDVDFGDPAVAASREAVEKAKYDLFNLFQRLAVLLESV
jgi:hypothetical protein